MHFSEIIKLQLKKKKKKKKKETALHCIVFYVVTPFFLFVF